ncbi:GFA family protein [Sinisalibacter aestuarii]|uniref:Aldehyde-activating protein n=1 Tax=Sinisalibacter aestuarii TaxID=2949426 RepID=A0ABQ5LSY3_9RHOB|nr:GFA family protein [Sinisalibacter aestuarii]GKY87853.1 aldehyde-activating protein [Sinisalibacter aestuarii]
MELLDQTTRRGGCQCGALRYEARAILDNPHICHCRMCQRASGNFFAALVGVPNEALTWQGEPAIFESSEGVERGFCRDCGTPMFYRHRDGSHCSIMIGTFDDPASVPLFYEFGIESRLPQIDRLGHVERYTSDELIDAAAIAHIRETSRQYPL